MAKNKLQDINIDEDQLEIAFYKLGEETEINLVSINLRQLKLDIKGFSDCSKTSRKLYCENPFIQLRYSKKGKIRVYPFYEPAEDLDVRILGYKPVFNEECNLVLCERYGKRFIFFDPTQNKDYEPELESERKIQIAAVTISDLIISTPFERENNLEVEPFVNPAGKGRHYWNSPLYRSTFELNGVKKKRGNYFILDVLNPFDENKSLEVLTNMKDYDDSIERIESQFYFIGTLKKN